MKILITGFKPFLAEKINPSEKLAVDLAQSFQNVRCLILPVEFQNSFQILKTYLDQNEKPDYLIMLGQASGRKNICFEKIALNWLQTSHCDEVGYRPVTGPILPETELAIMTDFSIDQFYLKLLQQNAPVEISFSAGTFVCNHLYFQVLNKMKELESVFIHVPLLPEQIKNLSTEPCLNYDAQFKALSSFIKLLNEKK